MALELLGIDGDDTLWHCQREFDNATEQFTDVVAPWVADGANAAHVLDDTERRNLEVFGFGVKAFTLSMVEAAIEVTEGTIPASEIRRLVAMAKAMMTSPIDVLPGVAEALRELKRDHRLALVTKGDLLHQRRKLAASGLTECFDHIEVVTDKSPRVYSEVLDRLGIAVKRFVMVGDSVKSDVLPVLAIGGRAVHVRSEHQWHHERAHHDGSVPTTDNFADVPGLVRGLATAF